MYFMDHGTPHFHAIYAEYNGVFEVESARMMEGDLPARAQALVQEWAQRYRVELAEMWRTQQFRALPGLE
jgi:hypothetical protein